jgi:hypothetical protein
MSGEREGMRMEEEPRGTKPFNIRMPVWAIDYIDHRSKERGVTKTDVVVEALWRLRSDDVRQLLRAGYEEMRETDLRLAEEVMVVSGGDLGR